MANDTTVKALIIRTTDVGESDRIMSILTPEFGKTSVYGRGVRSIKSHRLHTCQLFCYAEMTLTNRSGMYSLKEATLLEDFYSIREDINRFALAQYVAEVLDTVTVSEQEQSEILSLALNTLYMLTKADKPLEVIKGVFELRLACLLGYMPNLMICCECNKSEGSFYLCIEDGCIICSECLMNIGREIPILPLSQRTLDCMRYVCLSKPKRIFAFNLEDPDTQDFANACEKYLLSHLGRSFDTLNFYNTIK